VKWTAYFTGQLLICEVSAFSFSFLAALGAYLFAVFVASVVTAAKTEWKLFWILPLVFPCYHFGYGYGFLRGVWDFVIRRNAHEEWAARLTRKE
jgi:branched-subunit amino acid ABC-type transport system permease component